MGTPKHMTSPSPLQVMGRFMVAPALILAILSGCMFFDEIDRCLDRGGRWDDATDACKLDAQSTDAASVREAQTTATVFLRVGRAGT